jgi:mannose-6-phosphate isomerase-like protein (cupin superfamily)
MFVLLNTMLCNFVCRVKGFFGFEKGQGKCIIDGNEYEVGDGFAVVVPAGAQHNIINTSKPMT